VYYGFIFYPEYKTTRWYGWTNVAPLLSLSDTYPKMAGHKLFGTGSIL